MLFWPCNKVLKPNFQSIISQNNNDCSLLSLILAKLLLLDRSCENIFALAVSSVAKRTLSVREVWGSIPGPVKSAQCRQRLATVATFLRSCVAQALSRGDGPRNSLHASA